MAISTEYSLKWDRIRPEHTRVLGQKCARLAEIKQMNFPVPPFFALTTRAVGEILDRGGIPDHLKEVIREGIGGIEQETGMVWGGAQNPLLLAVRSGDPVHLAGALTTFINVGLSDRTLNGMIVRHAEEPTVLRMYLDLMVDFARKVGRVGREKLQPILDRMRERPQDPPNIRQLIGQTRQIFEGLPQSPEIQVYQTVEAIARSWVSSDVAPYKDTLRLDPSLLPSIIIQQMSFSGFAFSAFAAFSTRNPVTGEAGLYGDYSPQMEGRWLMRSSSIERWPIEKVDEHFPGTYQYLADMGSLIEVRAKHPQDMEVAIEKGQVWVLQSVNAVLSNKAREAVTAEFRDAQILIGSEPLPSDDFRVAAVKTFKLNPRAQFKELARGVVAHPGAVEGRLALSIDAAARYHRDNEPAILVIASPDERVLHMLLGRKMAGLLATYGSTHDEAVTRLSLLPAVMSAHELTIEEGRYLKCPDGTILHEGERVVLDADGGRLLMTEHPDPVIEDRIVSIAPHGIDGYLLEKETRERYQGASYERLLNDHARLVEEKKIKIDLIRKDPVMEALLELVTHFVHFMIKEEGQRLGKTEGQVRLDVACADGNLDRVPGFENLGFVFKRTSRQQEVPVTRQDEVMNRVFGKPLPQRYREIPEFLVVAGVFYDYRGRPDREEEMRKKAECELRIRRVIEQGRIKGTAIFLHEDSRMVDYVQGRVHGGTQVFVGLRFAADDMSRVLDLLREEYK
jgi:pyruvate,orthophosphate dikinase